MVKDKKKSLNLALIAKGIKKQISDDAATILTSSSGYASAVAYWVPTGCPSLDAILGGGIAGGRIIEIFSHHESEGKTTFAYQLAREAQKMGGVVLYIDAEHTADPKLMEQIGVNVSESFMMSSPNTLEEMFSVIELFMDGVREQLEDHSIPVVIILDSVAAAMPQEQEDVAFGKIQIASQAKAISTGLRKLNTMVSKAGATLILLNQSRQKIGVMFGDPNDTPGGKAMKFYASQRLALSKVGKILDGDKKVGAPWIGIEVRFRVVKSKVARPHGVADLSLLFGKGFDYASSAFDLALSKGVVQEASKGVYEVEGVKGKIYKKNFGEVLGGHPEIVAKIAELAKAADDYATVDVATSPLENEDQEEDIEVGVINV